MKHIVTRTFLLLICVLLLSGASCTIQQNSTGTTETTTDSNPADTLVIEAGNGTLSGVESSTIDYVGKSARGLEAYLGSKNATATYVVEATKAGTYQLQVKLSDDGTWKNGYRDADIVVNGQPVLHYYHSSEDTRGWKWYTVGNASLKVGDNTVAFTKSTDMPAAFVMDEFKFVPVILQ